ncbi:aldo/keto reductase [Alkalihalobacillus oceani]|uniref:aldo/keto reductase n=1 Tax=Halalkalibacter oceani TaxID=1653776 RepID=UPI00203E1C17|nr:aldo/keto reductase [Halalkalibacter oceani]MCM3763234.1 aldo/keto reductase [Halalkalibacter oceani]
MKYSTLKKTDIEISKLGVGTNAIGGHNLYENLDEKQGQDFLREALNNGITFVDTADIYGVGRTEELVGEVLTDYPRDSYVLATKGGQTVDGPNNHPNYLREAVERSLSRLQVEYIDLYYLHFYDQKTPLVESIGELSRLVEEGKIKSIGVSNLTIDQLKEANNYNNISALQSPYNLLNRSVENDVLPYCIENNISFIPYGPLAFGILGGKYDKNFKLAEGDWRNSISLFEAEAFQKNLDKVNQLKGIASRKGTAVSNVSIAWLMTKEGIDSVIPGGKYPEHVKKNIKSLEVKFTTQDLEELNTIFS